VSVRLTAAVTGVMRVQVLTATNMKTAVCRETVCQSVVPGPLGVCKLCLAGPRVEQRLRGLCCVAANLNFRHDIAVKGPYCGQSAGRTGLR
jgi:hypothetical protein